LRLKRGPGARDGDPGALRQTDAAMTSNEPLRLKVLGAPKPRLCERCGRRAAQMLIVGEIEGMAIWICKACRSSKRFPMMLTRKGRAR
jgi:RNase P subunit RPR2